MEDAMTVALRFAVILLFAAVTVATAARGCNETCAAGFVFSDSEGVCVRAATGV
jgi:hypothetical protein